MDTRGIYGYVYQADGTAYEGATVTLTSFTRVYQADGSVAASIVLTLTTNAAGRYSSDVVAPARYVVAIPGETFGISVPLGDGSDVSVESLRASTGLPATNAVQTAIDASLLPYLLSATAATTYEPQLGNPAANGYVLSSTTTGTRSWIAAPSGGGTTVVYGSWINLTFDPTNGWSNYNVIPAGYRKVTIGGVDTYVELRGEIYRATFAAGLTIATLPVGFRPPTNWRQLFKIFSNTGDGQIIVKDTGVIESYTGGTAMDLSNVRIYLV